MRSKHEGRVVHVQGSGAAQGSPPERLLVSVPTSATMLSISKSLAYELVKQGRIPTIRLSGHLRVPVKALEQVIEELAAESLPPARY